MKKGIHLSALIMILVLVTWSVPSAHSAKFAHLRVIVKNLKSDFGHVRVALFRSRRNFKLLTKAHRKVVLPIKNGQAVWIEKSLTYGEYAIAMFHDENDNEKQDKLFGGFPSEPYRYSTNPKVLLNWGRPDFNDVKFRIKAPRKTIIIYGSFEK